jgi:molecular chaperone DnaK (HSP70)
VAQPKSIGLKLFDDSFIPVLTEGEVKNKKVILTTVRDDQKKMIIELYEGTSTKCIHNEFLGKLVMPIDRTTKKGSPAIEVHFRLDEDGMLYAKAWDTESGKETEIKIQHSVSKRIKPETLTDKEIKKLSKSKTTTKVEAYEEEEKGINNTTKMILIIAVAVLVLALLGIGSWFGVRAIYPSLKNMFAATKKEKKEIVKKEDTKKIEEKKDIISEQKEEKKVEEKKITGLKDLEGTRHYIRWGDNLWTICKKYYGDPWYYPAVADYNSIKNPRRIFAGTYLTVPPKSNIKRWEFVK